jgi:DNA repair exonuclease SbcCD ATPase subunit
MSESALIALENQMHSRMWDSLPEKQLSDLLHQVQTIHRDLTSAGKARAEVISTHIRDLIQLRETEQRHRELQEKMTSIHAILDRSEKLAMRFEQQMDRLVEMVSRFGQQTQRIVDAAGRFEQQMEKLLGFAERQKFLAEKLDRQTTHLILLTYAVVALTVALFVVTFKEMANAHSVTAEQRQKQ